jgi:tetratricopeptide (TPR) repeat protein
MDLLTIVYVVMLTIGGVALDTYQNPKMVVVDVIKPGSNSTPSLDRAFISAVVFGEIDRAVKVRSLITRPEIAASGDKSTIATIAEALGGGPLVGAFSELLAISPSRLQIGVLNENGKLAVFVNGHKEQLKLDRQPEYFDNLMYPEQNETVTQLIKRSTVEGLSQIDPYLAMIYMLDRFHRSNDMRYVNEALRIAARVTGKASAGEELLLARLTNLEGLVHLNRGDLEKARTTFLRAIGYVRDKPILALAVMNMNLAFIEIAQGNPDSAAARMANLLAPGGILADDMVLRTVTSEGLPLELDAAESALLRSNGIVLAGSAALARNDLDSAQRSGKKALELSPTRLTALALLADIAERRGNAAEAARLRASIVDLQSSGHAYMELAGSIATLSLAGPAPKVNPSLYVYP